MVPRPLFDRLIGTSLTLFVRVLWNRNGAALDDLIAISGRRWLFRSHGLNVLDEWLQPGGAQPLLINSSGSGSRLAPRGRWLPSR